VAQGTIRETDVAHALFQGSRIRETTVPLTFPQQMTIQRNLKNTAGAGFQRDLCQILGEGMQQFLCHPR